MISRREFVKLASAAGGGLLVGVWIPSLRGAAEATQTGDFEPNAFLRIGGDGRVVLTMPYVEMGQGTYTAIPMLIAEELEVELSQVHLEHAPANEKLYANPLFGLQATGGSTTIRAAWNPMRVAGATARVALVAAAAKRWNVDPSTCHAERARVFHAATGRVASYSDLASEAAAGPVPKDVALKPAASFRLIGTPAKRLDSPSKVNGSATYGIDARPVGVRIATLAQSPVFGGRVKAVDDTAARAVKGVLQVVRLDDAVAVIPEHMGAAKKGLAALQIQWDDGPHANLTTAAIVSELEAATLKGGAVARNTGNADHGILSAARRIDAVYQVPFLAHAAMEPMNCTVDVRSDQCEVWVGTQVINRARLAAAQVTGLPPDKVGVHNHLIGGGFGRRLEVDGITRAVQIAKAAKGPVKVVWTREEDVQHDMYRPLFLDRISAGLDGSGIPVAWHHRFAGSSILARWLPPAFKNGFDPDTVECAATLAYDIPNVLVEYQQVEPPGIPTAFWRSVGPSHNVFVVESFMDELAAAAKQDPVEYRRKLLNSSPRLRAVLDLAAEKGNWGGRLPARTARGVAIQFGFGSYMAQVAQVEVATDGTVRVRRVDCAIDCGMVVNPNTVEAQVQGAVIFGLSAALHGEITLKDGRVEQSNFHTYPVVRMDEVPEIAVHIVRNSEAPGGVGEPGTPAIAPAVANAIYAATGVRLRKMPIDPAALKTGA